MLTKMTGNSLRRITFKIHHSDRKDWERNTPLCSFYPRDATLVHELATALCLSVCHKSVFYKKG